MKSRKDQFLLDPDMVFLNHGSFGACPKPVFQVYQAWQHEMERQPVEFLSRRSTGLMATARGRLAEYLGAQAGEIVFFPNPTTAINMVGRSLKLGPGDEILTTDHEYGAMNRTWRFISRQTGARYVARHIPLPVRSREEVVETFWSGVNEHTRVIFVSHITSSTALILPVEEICRQAREAGILTVVDGAHAPGQIPLNLPALGADLYTGACHKWMMAPKGAAFLYARPEVQEMLDPLVVSWGYESEYPSGSQFIDYHEWQGTRDLAAFLSVPAAIEFQERNHWDEVRAACHELGSQTRERLNTITGEASICPDSPEWFGQMFAARLPEGITAKSLVNRLYEEHQIEVATTVWNEENFLRISFQGYNSQEDADALIEALIPVLRRNPVESE